ASWSRSRSERALALSLAPSAASAWPRPGSFRSSSIRTETESSNVRALAARNEARRSGATTAARTDSTKPRASSRRRSADSRRPSRRSAIASAVSVSACPARSSKLRRKASASSSGATASSAPPERSRASPTRWSAAARPRRLPSARNSSTARPRASSRGEVALLLARPPEQAEGVDLALPVAQLAPQRERPRQLVGRARRLAGTDVRGAPVLAHPRLPAPIADADRQVEGLVVERERLRRLAGAGREDSQVVEDRDLAVAITEGAQRHERPLVRFARPPGLAQEVVDAAEIGPGGGLGIGGPHRFEPAQGVLVAGDRLPPLAAGVADQADVAERDRLAVEVRPAPLDRERPVEVSQGLVGIAERPAAEPEGGL